MTIYLIYEVFCEAWDKDPCMEEGYPKVIEAYSNKDAAIAALAEWASVSGAVPYSGGPKHSVRVSDGWQSTYRIITETNLVT